MTSHFWLNVLLVCVVNLGGAWCWAVYIRAASDTKPLRAAFADGGLLLLQMVSVVSYVADHRLALPVLGSACVGTYSAVRWGKR